MRGTVAKRCRKILWAMQVKEKAPTGTDHRQHTRTGEVRCFGARAVYIGIKRAYKVRGGFVAEPPRRVTRAGLADKRREQMRENKRFSRQRRRAREREAWDDLTERLSRPIEVPQ